MKKILIFSALIILSTFIQAKQVAVLGLYVSSETKHPPGLPDETTVTITCALVSTNTCYIATVPDDPKIDPRVVNGELELEDQYTRIEIPNVETFTGRVTSHYQYNTFGESGRIERVHVLTIVR